MKFAYIIALIIALFPAFVGADAILKDKGRIGGVLSCTQDTNVDVAFATTVAVDAAAAQKVIGFTAVTNLVAGDTVLIDADNSGPRREVCVVASISTLDVTCVSNLEFAHTAAQADDIVLTNRIGPLSRDNIYWLTLTTTTGTAQPGRWLFGDQYVDTETDGGVTTLGTPGTSVKVYDSGLYLSFKSFAANAIANVCLIR